MGALLHYNILRPSDVYILDKHGTVQEAWIIFYFDSLVVTTGWVYMVKFIKPGSVGALHTIQVKIKTVKEYI